MINTTKNSKTRMTKLMTASLTTLFLSGCMASGTWTAGVSNDVGADCTLTDADQVRIAYTNPYVPAYLTVSINNGQFVFDECAPDEAQGTQGDFHVSRGSGTQIEIGLPAASTMHDMYFGAYTGSSPVRSDMTIKIMGRSSCYSAPYTILPSTAVLLAWQSVSGSVGLCRADGWDGSTTIQ